MLVHHQLEAAKRGGCCHGQVLTLTPSGQAVYEQIFVFSHRAQKEAAVFTSLTSESGHKLSATPGHYIWAAKPGQKASIVRMGDIEVSLQAQGQGCKGSLCSYMMLCRAGRSHSACSPEGLQL